jgi:ATP-dependent protease HslVU (ClpYQ) peptidase subunit
MTIIACNDSVMIADTKVSVGNLSFPSSKVYLVDGDLIGAAGQAATIDYFIAGLRKHGVGKSLHSDKKLKGSLEAIVLTKTGEILFYDSKLSCIKVKRGYHAIGTGAEATLGALVALKSHNRDSLILAVEAACEVNTHCGLPIEIFELEKQFKKAKAK